jgi:hypothetical protein
MDHSNGISRKVLWNRPLNSIDEFDETDNIAPKISSSLCLIWTLGSADITFSRSVRIGEPATIG